MFHHAKPRPEKIIKNLSKIDFPERKEVQAIIDELAKTANNPYAASLPMMMSAQLGDKDRYDKTNNQFLSELNNKDHYESWMKLDSFAAWMWGRELLSADAMGDEKNVAVAKNQLNIFLKKKDNLAFAAWGEGYYAAFDKKAYEREAKNMMTDTDALIAASFNDKSNHAALSDALWACVMDIQAAANAAATLQYEQLKEKIILVAGAKSVSDSLSKGLLRAASSNDYPAWAMAIVRRAAAVMGDKDLYNELNAPLLASIKGAKNAGEKAQAEYALAITNNQFALEMAKEFRFAVGVVRKSSL